MYHAGRIVRRLVASPTVVVLELEVPSLSTFEAGQWVDFVVPPHDWIGGFSIASSPKDLPKLTLAIKRSSHPPSTWVHEESRVDQVVEVQVGGTSTLESITEEAAMRRPHVFCAGGIGISPVLSQYREFLLQRAHMQSNNGATPQPARFLYSVKTEEELIFGDEIVELARGVNAQNTGDEVIFSLTKSNTWETKSKVDRSAVTLTTGRQLKPFLDDCSTDSIFYLCGPPQMLDEAERHLRTTRGIDPSNIRFEKWW